MKILVHNGSPQDMLKCNRYFVFLLIMEGFWVYYSNYQSHKVDFVKDIKAYYSLKASIFLQSTRSLYTIKYVLNSSHYKMMTTHVCLFFQYIFNLNNVPTKLYDLAKLPPATVTLWPTSPCNISIKYYISPFIEEKLSVQMRAEVFNSIQTIASFIKMSCFICRKTY